MNCIRLAGHSGIRRDMRTRYILLVVLTVGCSQRSDPVADRLVGTWSNKKENGV